MMKMMLLGALGADAEVKEVGSRKVINFSVAVNKDYRNSEGKKVEKTDWIRAQYWRNEGQSIAVAEFLKKGKKVLIEGDPSVEAYLSRENVAKGNLAVTVKSLELVG